MLPAIIGAGLYAAGTGLDMLGQNRAARAQAGLNDSYNQMQAIQAALEAQRQEALRKEADAARVDTLNYVSADSQKKRQAAEETRLGGYLNSTAKDDAYYGLSGQQNGGEEFKSTLARELAKAAGNARDRIKNMATTSSYTGSYGGLGTDNPLAFQRSGATIDLMNDFRRGSLAAYQRFANIQPGQVSYQPGVVPGLMKTVGGAMLGAGAQQAGGWLASGGSLFGGGSALPSGSYFADPSAFQSPAYFNFKGA